VTPNPTPLAGQVAILRRDLQATPAPAWVPSAIHALILACLLRIFGKLEDLIALWAAGQLPAFPEPAARAAVPRTRTPVPAARANWFLALFAPAPEPQAWSPSGMPREGALAHAATTRHSAPRETRALAEPAAPAHLPAAAPRAGSRLPSRKPSGTACTPPGAARHAPTRPSSRVRAPAHPPTHTARAPPCADPLFSAPSRGTPSHALNVPLS